MLRQSPKMFFLFMLVSLLTLTSFVQAQVSWESLTSFGTVRTFYPVADTVYAVTSGGLLKIVDPSSPPKTFVNTDGPGTCNLFDMLRDGDGIDWIAAAGRVMRREHSSFRQIPLLDLDSKLFNALSLADDGTRLWVGTSIGLVVIDKTENSGEVVEFYDHFGNLNAGAAVNDIVMTGDSIWLATNTGLAMARRNNLVALNAPGNWTTWNVLDFPALGSDTIRRVTLYHDSLYLATSHGAYTFDRSLNPPVLRPNSFTSDQVMTDLVVAKDTLFLVYRDGMAAVVTGSTFFYSPFGLSATMTSTGSRQWFGRSNSTIGYRDASGSTEYPFTGLPSNDIADVAFAGSNGSDVLHIVARNSALFRYTNGIWVSLFDPPGWNTNQLIASGADQVFAALEGGGIVSAGSAPTVRYDTSGTTLRGVPEGHNFLPVRGMAVSDGILYAACYRAFNNFPIAMVRTDALGTRSAWDSLGISNGIFDNFVVSVAAHGDYLAVGTEANGLFVHYLGPNPFDKRDDRTTLFTETSGNLISNVVRVVCFSADGELWVGTNFGLSRFDPSIETRASDVTLPLGFGPDITDLEFDTRGTLWMSAANGLARLDFQSASFTTYTTQNSQLLSDNIRSLTIDPATNDLYISTPDGISVLRSGQGVLVDGLSGLLASPNPFVIDRPDKILRFNAKSSGELSIFSASGDLIYTSSIMEWNGRNRDGQLVVSGVYLFTISDTNGHSGRGKFLLIRQ